MNTKRDSHDVDKVPGSDIVELVCGVLGLPRINTEALVVFPGMGESCRIQEAVNIWNEYNHNYLLVAGDNKGDTRRDEPDDGLEIDNLVNSFRIEDSSGVYTQVFARNTKEQADWVVGILCPLGVKKISLCVPAFFMPRAWLTLFKSCLNSGYKVVIVPELTPASPLEVVPWAGVDEFSLISGEMERIRAYQQKGDVATLREFEEYLCWLWHTPGLIKI